MNRLCPSAGQAGYISGCFVKEDTELIGSTKLGFIFVSIFKILVVDIRSVEVLTSERKKYI